MIPDAHRQKGSGPLLGARPGERGPFGIAGQDDPEEPADNREVEHAEPAGRRNDASTCRRQHD